MKSLWLILLSATVAFGQGTILWDESVNGPLSNLVGSATSLGALQAGSNTVIGSAETIPTGQNWLSQDDFFSFSVPTGFQVTAVKSTVDRSIWAWIGDLTFSTQYGFAVSPSNGDLLPQWQLNLLSPGVYGMYISNNDLQAIPTVANYRLDFVVQSIPEPSGFSLLLVGAGLVGLRCWRKIHLTKN